ncbi:hypothetical protein HFO56_00440 [Rhizobium laguerreae]|uniref:hypothetical protein n=1 Tax=Rhizobium laguerreae TaxID=1076926 RepID=UPI001C8FE413|nr:hypothetical protein [Rhizobium laguerreae]MBY3150896.1 hypothetical protein [Rhizobium laguerreae]
MGGGRWTATDWNTYSSAKVSGKTTSQVFTATGMKPEFDPAIVQFRESRDSADNPRSRPIILGCDVTGSMGMVADTLIRGGINDLATDIQATKEIGDPHVMVMAIGDAYSDEAPLQVTQFEADIRIADQTSQLWLEKGGGINSGESYALAHLFGAKKVVADAFKRGQKGFLFTIGDEPPVGVTAKQAKDFLGLDIGSDFSAAQCAALALDRFETYHVILLNEGYCASGGRDAVVRAWEKVLPQRLILLDDITKLSEAVVAAIRIGDGASKASTCKSVAVANAVGSLVDRGKPSGGVARLA